MNNAKHMQPRSGCHDMWNAFMVKDASFAPGSDIPYCVSTETIPHELISYEDAKALYKKQIRSGNKDFHVNAFIHFFIDDQKFDGKRSSIWTYPEKALEIICHFAGIISPDFSTNADFPDPWKRFNTYRMRAFGCWMNSLDIPVINCVRWGTYETWSYCFDGIPIGSTLCIGTVASGIRKLSNRPLFEDGLKKLANVIKPSKILVYGSANYSVFDSLQQCGIEIISFDSKTCKAYKEVPHEQSKQ